MTATTITQTFPYYCSSPLKKTDHLLSFEVSFQNDSKRTVFLEEGYRGEGKVPVWERTRERSPPGLLEKVRVTVKIQLVALARP